VAVRDDPALQFGVASDGGLAEVRHVLDRLDRAGIEVADLAIKRPTLDDVFLTLTGHVTTPPRGDA
jgi:ABC-2 type transport system ATP-binding protein